MNPPKDSGPTGVARLRYRDKAGASRTYDWALDDPDNKMPLGEVDLDEVHAKLGR